jgi:hypothetical protein
LVARRSGLSPGGCVGGPADRGDGERHPSGVRASGVRSRRARDPSGRRGRARF